MNPAKMVPVAEASPSPTPKRRPIIAKVRHLNAAQHIAVAPDNDIAGWRRRLKELFSTSSPPFVEASLKQLIAASKLPGETAASTTSISAALARESVAELADAGTMCGIPATS